MNPCGSGSFEEEVKKIEMIKSNDMSHILADYHATSLKDLFRQNLSSLFTIPGNNGYRSSVIDYACTPKNQTTEFVFKEYNSSPCCPRRVPSPISPQESSSPMRPSSNKDYTSGIPYLQVLRDYPSGDDVTEIHLPVKNTYMNQSSDSSTPSLPQPKRSPYTHSYSNTGTSLSAMQKPISQHKTSQSLNWPGLSGTIPSRHFSPMPTNQPIPKHYRTHQASNGNSVHLSISPRTMENSIVPDSLHGLAFTPYTPTKEEQSIPYAPSPLPSSVLFECFV